jgi:hypothetical protein
MRNAAPKRVFGCRRGPDSSRFLPASAVLAPAGPLQ